MSPAPTEAECERAMLQGDETHADQAGAGPSALARPAFQRSRGCNRLGPKRCCQSADHDPVACWIRSFLATATPSSSSSMTARPHGPFPCPCTAGRHGAPSSLLAALGARKVLCTRRGQPREASSGSAPQERAITQCRRRPARELLPHPATVILGSGASTSGSSTRYAPRYPAHHPAIRSTFFSPGMLSPSRASGLNRASSGSTAARCRSHTWLSRLRSAWRRVQAAQDAGPPVR